MGKKYTTDEIHIGGHELDAAMMVNLNTVVSDHTTYLTSLPSHTHDDRYVQEGGTSFSGVYPMVVRVGTRSIYSDADITFTGSTSQLYVGGSIKAPIFYDSDNTGYFLNPAGTSLLNGLEVDGDIDMRAQVGNWITSDVMSDAIGWNTNYGVYIGSNVGGTHYLRGNGTFTTGGSTYNLWHAGNDGSGSGLDADTLDGQHASAFQAAGNYFTDGDTVLNMSNNDGLVYNDTNNIMYIKADGTDYPIIDVRGGTLTGTIYANGGIHMGNTNLTNVNHITINDPGSGEGIEWLGGNGWKIFESNDSNSNGAGNLQFSVGSVHKFRVDTSGHTTSIGSSRAPTFYDSNNTGYYLNPAETSNINTLNAATINRNPVVTLSGDVTGNATMTNLGSINITTAVANDSHEHSYIKAGGDGPGTEDLNAVADSVAVGRLSYRGYNSSSTNKPPAADNANGVITVGQHSGGYNAQVAFSSNGNMYWRDNPSSSNGSWRTIWDSDNDGTGSGLDADLLDGQHASAFAPVSHTHTWANINGETANSVNAWGGLRHQTNDGYIDFGPANSSHAHIYTDRANFYFNKALTVNGQSVINTSDIRSAIFYDLDNTGYYGNFASNSRYNTAQGNYLGLGTAANTSGGYRLNMGGSVDMNANSIDYISQLHFNDNVRFYDDGNDSYLNFKYGDANAGGIRFLNGGGSLKGYVYASNDGFGLLDSDGTWAVRTQTGTDPLTLYCDNNPEFYVYNSYTYSPGSSRAPTFYDSNNTGYYVNPASTSSLNTVAIAGTTTLSGRLNLDLTTDYDSTVVTGLTQAPIQIADVNIGSTDAYLPLAHMSARYTSGYRTHMNIGLKKTASAWGDSTTGMYVALGGHDNYPTRNWLFSYGGYIKSGVDGVYAWDSFRAPIFYDSNNTGYYVNPASTSTVNGVNYINNTIPIVVKVNSGYKSWAHHISSNDDYVLAPSTTDGSETWSWDNGFNFKATGDIMANNFLLRSDERLKTKITDLPCDNIDVVWRSFELKSDEGNYRTGVIAQELEKTNPEFVDTDDKGFKSVKYVDLLIAKIAELEARLEKLEK